ncbi:MAG: bifunctional UDP-N-acetylglucosamine diphosphorylase/glucosamine-1-phosphate N-acetyltransferase GlmU [Ardenticatenaceae bacterium]
MLDVVILAAGMGTRMKSNLPKVLHPVAGRPMISEVLATAKTLNPLSCVIVIGHGADRVRETVGEAALFAFQAQRLGTGHAVMQARAALEKSGAQTVLVLYGDTPLTQAETLQRAIAHHEEHKAAVTLLSFLPDDSTGYGRIIRNEGGVVTGIVEHKDATPEQREIQESNSGIMLFDGPWLWENLDNVTLSPQGEYYLTDMPGIAVAQGRRVEGLIVDEREVMGVNNRVQLAEASQQLWARRREKSMLSGVAIIDPTAVWIDADVTIGRDTIIHPNVVLRGKTTIGANCEIGPHAVLENATLADHCRVNQSQIVDSTLAEGVSVGPFAVIRGDSVLEERVHVGAGAEINRSHLGPDSMMSHFGYLGDATLGARVNVGAGTITCNYDGKQKQATKIGNDVLLGSDTLLIAPVTLGHHAQTGAGAVVTHDVPPEQTVIGIPARRKK